MTRYFLVKEEKATDLGLHLSKPTLAASKGIVYEAVFAEVPVPSEAEKVIESWEVVEDKYVQSLEVVDKTTDEMAEVISTKAAEAIEATKAGIIENHYQDNLAVISVLSDEDALDVASQFAPYEVGKVYTTEERFYYPLNEKLYKVLQGHTSQADWLPTAAVSLYVEVAPPGVIPDWVQPTGEHDAYNIGDEVMFEGAHYVSLINANVWSPAAYPDGWEVIL